MYVCIYVCIVCVCVCVCLYVCMCIYMYVHLYTIMCVCMYVSICMYVMYINISLCIETQDNNDKFIAEMIASDDDSEMETELPLAMISSQPVGLPSEEQPTTSKGTVLVTTPQEAAMPKEKGEEKTTPKVKGIVIATPKGKGKEKDMPEKEIAVVATPKGKEKATPKSKATPLPPPSRSISPFHKTAAPLHKKTTTATTAVGTRRPNPHCTTTLQSTGVPLMCYNCQSLPVSLPHVFDGPASDETIQKILRAYWINRQCKKLASDDVIFYSDNW